MMMNRRQTEARRTREKGAAGHVGAWSVFLLLLTALAAPTVRPSTQGIASGTPVAAPVVRTPLCLGRDDLIVDGMMGGDRMTLSGMHTYSSVCVRHGGTLLIDHQATLRAGAFYLDDSSSIIADGLPGGTTQSGPSCLPESGNGTPNGDPGSTLVIQARTVIIAGGISARGGAGFNSTGDTACGDGYSGKGGEGGAVTIQAATLVLTGTVSARGGAGGLGFGTTGHGGPGGTIAVTAALFRPMLLTARLDVEGGQDGGTGAPATTGSTRVATLAPTALSALPPAPAPLVTVLGPAPARLVLQSVGVFGMGMTCGPGDLTVPPGTTYDLTGTRTYPHVCVSGVLRAGRYLTLRAQTILVARGGRLEANKAVPVGKDATGDYETTGACAADRRAPHEGVPGVEGPGSNGDIRGGKGGAGGGDVTLLAQRVLLGGTLSANGGDGGRGDGGSSPDSPGSPSSGPVSGGGGGDGGSGGGILIVTDAVQVSGTISARGGRGGPPGDGEGPAQAVGAVGGPGCIKVFANTVRTPLGSVLDVSGPLLIGRPLLSDLPPATAPGS